jgi:hypothetical protein
MLKVLHIADVAEIQEAVIYELKKVQKKEFSGRFSEKVRPRKSIYIYIYIYSNEAYFELKNGISFLMFLRFKKNPS